MICATRSRASAPAGASACRLSGGCSATHNRGRRGRYAHLADDLVREAADKITTVISNAGRQGADVTTLRRPSVMSGAKEIVESIVELFVATAGSASASSIACWHGTRRPNGRRGDRAHSAFAAPSRNLSLKAFWIVAGPAATTGPSFPW
jgi:hypothetical protein